MAIEMYSFTSKIRYSETDEENVLKLHNVVNYLQDCSTFQSESIGMGLEHLKSMHRVWVLNSWQIDIRNWDELKVGKEIQVGTWMCDYNGVLARRNFIMNDKEGNRVVNANSVWVLLDTDTLRPVRIKEEDVANYQQEEPLEMECLGRKIVLPEHLQEQAPFPVRKYHLDSNHHVNNSSYFLMAEELVPEGVRPRIMRAEYRKSALLHDMIHPAVGETKTGYVAALNDGDGKPFAIIELLL